MDTEPSMQRIRFVLSLSFIHILPVTLIFDIFPHFAIQELCDGGYVPMARTAKEYHNVLETGTNNHIEPSCSSKKTKSRQSLARDGASIVKRKLDFS